MLPGGTSAYSLTPKWLAKTDRERHLLDRGPEGRAGTIATCGSLSSDDAGPGWRVATVMILLELEAEDARNRDDLAFG